MVKKSFNEIVKDLKRQKGWFVREQGKDLELIKYMRGRAITVRLKRLENNQFRLIFPSYIFQSPISHWGPETDEVRFCRNKSMLTSLIKALKRSAVWKYIDNQHFLVINKFNAKSDKRVVKKSLLDLYEYEPPFKKSK